MVMTLVFRMEVRDFESYEKLSEANALPLSYIIFVTQREENFATVAFATPYSKCEDVIFLYILKIMIVFFMSHIKMQNWN